MQKKLLLFLLVSVLITSCAVPAYQSKIKYFDKERNFKVTITSDFEKCRKVGIRMLDGEKTIFETWEKGGGKELEFYISDRVLKEGDNFLKLFCDDKPYPQTVQIKNSKYPYMNLINVGFEESVIVKPEYEPLFSDTGFYVELSNYMRLSKENYSKTKDLINFFPTHLRVQLLIDIAEKYNDTIILRNVASLARQLLHEEKSNDLLMLLYKKNNPDVDYDVTNILLSRPVKRYFDTFFQVMVTRANIYPLIIEHLTTNPSTEFSQLVFNYIKDKAEKNDMIDFVVAAFPVFLKNQVDANVYTKQLLFAGDKSKEQLALKIYSENGIDEQTGVYIREHWDKLSTTAKDALTPVMLKNFGNDPTFYKRFLNTDNTEIKKLLYEVGLQVPTRYKDADIINFYLSEDNRDLVNQYFLVAPKDIKFKGLSKFYEKSPLDINLLLGLKDVDPEYFAKKLIENFLYDKDTSNVVFAAYNLSEFGDRYLPELIKAYEGEKVNTEKRHQILAAIARASKAGCKYARDKVKTEPVSDIIKDVYRNIATLADGEILEELLQNLNKFPKDIFINVTMGFEETKKNINCEILKQPYTASTDKDIRFRVIWTWAYCCPDTYFDSMFDVFKNDMTEEVFLEALDGIRDIIKDVKPSLKDKGFNFIENVYHVKKTKAVREKIVDIVFDAGDKTKLQIIQKLSQDAETKEEKEFFEERISAFKSEKDAN